MFEIQILSWISFSYWKCRLHPFIVEKYVRGVSSMSSEGSGFLSGESVRQPRHEPGAGSILKWCKGSRGRFRNKLSKLEDVLCELTLLLRLLALWWHFCLFFLKCVIFFSLLLPYFVLWCGWISNTLSWEKKNTNKDQTTTAKYSSYACQSSSKCLLHFLNSSVWTWRWNDGRWRWIIITGVLIANLNCMFWKFWKEEIHILLNGDCCSLSHEWVPRLCSSLSNHSLPHSSQANHLSAVKL